MLWNRYKKNLRNKKKIIINLILYKGIKILNKLKQLLKKCVNIIWKGKGWSLLVF